MKEVTPHTLRRTFLTYLYNKTGDLGIVQQLAGHRTRDY